MSFTGDASDPMHAGFTASGLGRSSDGIEMNAIDPGGATQPPSTKPNTHEDLDDRESLMSFEAREPAADAAVKQSPLKVVLWTVMASVALLTLALLVNGSILGYGFWSLYKTARDNTAFEYLKVEGLEDLDARICLEAAFPAEGLARLPAFEIGDGSSLQLVLPGFKSKHLKEENPVMMSVDIPEIKYGSTDLGPGKIKVDDIRVAINEEMPLSDLALWYLSNSQKKNAAVHLKGVLKLRTWSFLIPISYDYHVDMKIPLKREVDAKPAVELVSLEGLQVIEDSRKERLRCVLALGLGEALLPSFVEFNLPELSFSLKHLIDSKFPQDFLQVRIMSQEFVCEGERTSEIFVEVNGHEQAESLQQVLSSFRDGDLDFDLQLCGTKAGDTKLQAWLSTLSVKSALSTIMSSRPKRVLDEAEEIRRTKKASPSKMKKYGLLVLSETRRLASRLREASSSFLGGGNDEEVTAFNLEEIYAEPVTESSTYPMSFGFVGLEGSASHPRFIFRLGISTPFLHKLTGMNLGAVRGKLPILHLNQILERRMASGTDLSELEIKHIPEKNGDELRFEITLGVTNLKEMTRVALKSWQTQRFGGAVDLADMTAVSVGPTGETLLGQILSPFRLQFDLKSGSFGLKRGPDYRPDPEDEYKEDNKKAKKLKIAGYALEAKRDELRSVVHQALLQVTSSEDAIGITGKVELNREPSLRRNPFIHLYWEAVHVSLFPSNDLLGRKRQEMLHFDLKKGSFRAKMALIEPGLQVYRGGIEFTLGMSGPSLVDPDEIMHQDLELVRVWKAMWDRWSADRSIVDCSLIVGVRDEHLEVPLEIPRRQDLLAGSGADVRDWTIWTEQLIQSKLSLAGIHEGVLNFLVHFPSIAGRKSKDPKLKIIGKVQLPALGLNVCVDKHIVRARQGLPVEDGDGIVCLFKLGLSKPIETKLVYEDGSMRDLVTNFVEDREAILRNRSVLLAENRRGRRAATLRTEAEYESDLRRGQLTNVLPMYMGVLDLDAALSIAPDFWNHDVNDYLVSSGYAERSSYHDRKIPLIERFGNGFISAFHEFLPRLGQEGFRHARNVVESVTPGLAVETDLRVESPSADHLSCRFKVTLPDGCFTPSRRRRVTSVDNSGIAELMTVRWGDTEITIKSATNSGSYVRIWIGQGQVYLNNIAAAQFTDTLGNNSRHFVVRVDIHAGSADFSSRALQVIKNYLVVAFNHERRDSEGDLMYSYPPELVAMAKKIPRQMFHAEFRSKVNSNEDPAAAGSPEEGSYSIARNFNGGFIVHLMHQVYTILQGRRRRRSEHQTVPSWDYHFVLEPKPFEDMRVINVPPLFDTNCKEVRDLMKRTEHEDRRIAKFDMHVHQLVYHVIKMFSDSFVILLKNIGMIKHPRLLDFKLSCPEMQLYGQLNGINAAEAYIKPFTLNRTIGLVYDDLPGLERVDNREALEYVDKLEGEVSWGPHSRDLADIISPLSVQMGGGIQVAVRDLPEIPGGQLQNSPMTMSFGTEAVDSEKRNLFSSLFCAWYGEHPTSPMIRETSTEPSRSSVRLIDVNLERMILEVQNIYIPWPLHAVKLKVTEPVVIELVTRDGSQDRELVFLSIKVAALELGAPETLIQNAAVILSKTAFGQLPVDRFSKNFADFVGALFLSRSISFTVRVKLPVRDLTVNIPMYMPTLPANIAFFDTNESDIDLNAVQCTYFGEMLPAVLGRAATGLMWAWNNGRNIFSSLMGVPSVVEPERVPEVGDEEARRLYPRSFVEDDHEVPSRRLFPRSSPASDYEASTSSDPEGLATASDGSGTEELSSEADMDALLPPPEPRTYAGVAKNVAVGAAKAVATGTYRLVSGVVVGTGRLVTGAAYRLYSMAAGGGQREVEGEELLEEGEEYYVNEFASREELPGADSDGTLSEPSSYSSTSHVSVQEPGELPRSRSPSPSESTSRSPSPSDSTSRYASPIDSTSRSSSPTIVAKQPPVSRSPSPSRNDSREYFSYGTSSGEEGDLSPEPKVVPIPESVVEQPSQEVVGEQPAVEEAVVEQTVEEAIVTQHHVEVPFVEQHHVKEPVTEQPISEEPIVERPPVAPHVPEEPLPEQPAVEQQVLEEPPVEPSIAYQPASRTTSEDVEVVVPRAVPEQNLIEDAVVTHPVPEHVEPPLEQPAPTQQPLESSVHEHVPPQPDPRPQADAATAERRRLMEELFALEGRAWYEDERQIGHNVTSQTTNLRDAANRPLAQREPIDMAALRATAEPVQEEPKPWAISRFANSVAGEFSNMYGNVRRLTSYFSGRPQEPPVQNAPEEEQVGHEAERITPPQQPESAHAEEPASDAVRHGIVEQDAVEPGQAVLRVSPPQAVRPDYEDIFDQFESIMSEHEATESEQAVTTHRVQEEPVVQRPAVGEQPRHSPQAQQHQYRPQFDDRNAEEPQRIREEALRMQGQGWQENREIGQNVATLTRSLDHASTRPSTLADMDALLADMPQPGFVRRTGSRLMSGVGGVVRRTGSSLLNVGSAVTGTVSWVGSGAWDLGRRITSYGWSAQPDTTPVGHDEELVRDEAGNEREQPEGTDRSDRASAGVVSDVGSGEQPVIGHGEVPDSPVHLTIPYHEQPSHSPASSRQAHVTERPIRPVGLRSGDHSPDVPTSHVAHGPVSHAPTGQGHISDEGHTTQGHIEVPANRAGHRHVADVPDNQGSQNRVSPRPVDPVGHEHVSDETARHADQAHGSQGGYVSDAPENPVGYERVSQGHTASIGNASDSHVGHGHVPDSHIGHGYVPERQIGHGHAPEGQVGHGHAPLSSSNRPGDGHVSQILAHPAGHGQDSEGPLSPPGPTAERVAGEPESVRPSPARRPDADRRTDVSRDEAAAASPHANIHILHDPTIADSHRHHIVPDRPETPSEIPSNPTGDRPVTISPDRPSAHAPFTTVDGPSSRVPEEIRERQGISPDSVEGTRREDHEHRVEHQGRRDGGDQRTLGEDEVPRVQGQGPQEHRRNPQEPSPLTPVDMDSLLGDTPQSGIFRRAGSAVASGVGSALSRVGSTVWSVGRAVTGTVGWVGNGALDLGRRASSSFRWSTQPDTPTVSEQRAIQRHPNRTLPYSRRNRADRRTRRANVQAESGESVEEAVDRAGQEPHGSVSRSERSPAQPESRRERSYYESAVDLYSSLSSGLPSFNPFSASVPSQPAFEQSPSEVPVQSHGGPHGEVYHGQDRRAHGPSFAGPSTRPEHEVPSQPSARREASTWDTVVNTVTAPVRMASDVLSYVASFGRSSSAPGPTSSTPSAIPTTETTIVNVPVSSPAPVNEATAHWTSSVLDGLRNPFASAPSSTIVQPDPVVQLRQFEESGVGIISPLQDRCIDGIPASVASETEQEDVHAPADSGAPRSGIEPSTAPSALGPQQHVAIPLESVAGSLGRRRARGPANRRLPSQFQRLRVEAGAASQHVDPEAPQEGLAGWWGSMANVVNWGRDRLGDAANLAGDFVGSIFAQPDEVEPDQAGPDPWIAPEGHPHVYAEGNPLSPGDEDRPPAREVIPGGERPDQPRTTESMGAFLRRHATSVASVASDFVTSMFTQPATMTDEVVHGEAGPYAAPEGHSLVDAEGNPLRQSDLESSGNEDGAPPPETWLEYAGRMATSVADIGSELVASLFRDPPDLVHPDPSGPPGGQPNPDPHGPLEEGAVPDTPRNRRLRRFADFVRDQLRLYTSYDRYTAGTEPERVEQWDSTFVPDDVISDELEDLTWLGYGENTSPSFFANYPHRRRVRGLSLSERLRVDNIFALSFRNDSDFHLAIVGQVLKLYFTDGDGFIGAGGAAVRNRFEEKPEIFARLDVLPENCRWNSAAVGYGQRTPDITSILRCMHHNALSPAVSCPPHSHHRGSDRFLAPLELTRNDWALLADENFNHDGRCLSIRESNVVLGIFDPHDRTKYILIDLILNMDEMENLTAGDPYGDPCGHVFRAIPDTNVLAFGQRESRNYLKTTPVPDDEHIELDAESGLGSFEVRPDETALCLLRLYTDVDFIDLTFFIGSDTIEWSVWNKNRMLVGRGIHAYGGTPLTVSWNLADHSLKIAEHGRLREHVLVRVTSPSVILPACRAVLKRYDRQYHAVRETLNPVYHSIFSTELAGIHWEAEPVNLDYTSIFRLNLNVRKAVHASDATSSVHDRFGFCFKAFRRGADLSPSYTKGKSVCVYFYPYSTEVHIVDHSTGQIIHKKPRAGLHVDYFSKPRQIKLIYNKMAPKQLQIALDPVALGKRYSSRYTLDLQRLLRLEADEQVHFGFFAELIGDGQPQDHLVYDFKFAYSLPDLWSTDAYFVQTQSALPHQDFSFALKLKDEHGKYMFKSPLGLNVELWPIEDGSSTVDPCSSSFVWAKRDRAFRVPEHLLSRAEGSEETGSDDLFLPLPRPRVRVSDLQVTPQGLYMAKVQIPIPGRYRIMVQLAMSSERMSDYVPDREDSPQSELWVPVRNTHVYVRNYYDVE